MQRVSCALVLAVGIGAVAFAQGPGVPRIWDDAALEDWATPIAGLNTRPAHYRAAEYYAAPAVNLRTYPLYHPDSEPAGYWEWLQQQKPEPLVDATRMRTNQDWIAAGERAFVGLHRPARGVGPRELGGPSGPSPPALAVVQRRADRGGG